MWKQVWWLVGKEIQFQRTAFVATILGTMLIAFFAFSASLPFLWGTSHSQDLFLDTFLLDLFIGGLTPAFATLFISSPYLSFRSIKEDPFGKRMAVYRVLPVPITVLSRSRMLFMLVTLMTMSTVFYTLVITAVHSFVEPLVTMQELVVFVLSWFGYSMVIGGINAYVESGTNGKVLWIFPFVFIFIFIAVVIFVYKTVGMGVVEWSFHLVQTIGWPLAVISLLLGTVSCLLTEQMLRKRLLNKDYM